MESGACQRHFEAMTEVVGYETKRDEGRGEYERRGDE
jgi:hypothetical protein